MKEKRTVNNKNGNVKTTIEFLESYIFLDKHYSLINNMQELREVVLNEIVSRWMAILCFC